jgi:hypothetical protein
LLLTAQRLNALPTIRCEAVVPNNNVGSQARRW